MPITSNSDRNCCFFSCLAHISAPNSLTRPPTSLTLYYISQTWISTPGTTSHRSLWLGDIVRRLATSKHSVFYESDGPTWVTRTLSRRLVWRYGGSQAIVKTRPIPQTRYASLPKPRVIAATATLPDWCTSHRRMTISASCQLMCG